MDVIVFTPDLFYKMKEDRHDYPDNPILSKVLLMDCFDEKKALDKYNAIFRSYQQNNTKFNNHNRKPRPKHSFSLEKTKLEKEINTCINLINASNHTKIIRRLYKVFELSEDKISVLTNILNRACSNDVYLTFIMLFFEMVPKEYRQEIFINFYNRHINSINAIIEELNTINYDDSDAYCYFCSVKKNFAIKHRCVILGKFDMNLINSYYSVLFSHIERFYLKPYVVDTLVNILVDLINSYPNLKDDFRKRCRDINLFATCNNKTKFTLEKVLNIKCF